MRNFQRSHSGRRERPLDKCDEASVQSLADRRVDYRHSRRFLARLRRSMRGDPQRAVRLAAVTLRSVSGWTPQMVGLVFGRGASGAQDMVRQAREELPKSVSQHFDHRVDNVAAIQVADAETILNAVRKNRHLFAADDHELDAATENLATALKRRMDDDT